MTNVLNERPSFEQLPQGATSAVMEMCIDNPREGFSNLFDTHPSIERRIAALIQFAGGHDPGPLDLPEESQDETTQPGTTDQQTPATPGPYRSTGRPRPRRRTPA